MIGYTIDSQFIASDTFDDLPVMPFERLTTQVAVTEFELFLPLTFRYINGLRKQKLNEARAAGIQVGHWVSSRAFVPEDLKVADNTLIYEGAIIQDFVELGENVIVRAGVNIGHHSRIGNHSFIASNAVTGGSVEVGERCWIGLGAVIRDGIKLAPRTFVGAGAVVLQDTEPDSVYVGVPARRMLNKTALGLTS